MLLTFSISFFAQEEEKERKRKNSLSADLARPILSDRDVDFRQFTYERAISDKFSALIGFGTGQYGSGSRQTINLGTGATVVEEEYAVNGNSLLLEGRFYPFRTKKVAPRGFFCGSYIKNYWLTEENKSIDASKVFKKKHQLAAFGIDMGYQFGKSWFLFEPVLGFGGTSSTELGEDSRADPRFSKFEASNYSVRFGLNVGICF